MDISDFCAGGKLELLSFMQHIQVVVHILPVVLHNHLHLCRLVVDDDFPIPVHFFGGEGHGQLAICQGDISHCQRIQGRRVTQNGGDGDGVLDGIGLILRQVGHPGIGGNGIIREQIAHNNIHGVILFLCQGHNAAVQVGSIGSLGKLFRQVQGDGIAELLLFAHVQGAADGGFPVQQAQEQGGRNQDALALLAIDIHPKILFLVTADLPLVGIRGSLGKPGTDTGFPAHAHSQAHFGNFCAIFHQNGNFLILIQDGIFGKHRLHSRSIDILVLQTTVIAAAMTAPDMIFSTVEGFANPAVRMGQGAVVAVADTAVEMDIGAILLAANRAGRIRVLRDLRGVKFQNGIPFIGIICVILEDPGGVRPGIVLGALREGAGIQLHLVP